MYDAIAADLAAEGFTVHRNPLVHWPTVTQRLTLAQLADIAGQPDNEALRPAVAELRRAGATDDTEVTVRTWHHITWNNCLVENSPQTGRRIYMPTFGYGDQASLAAIDDRMEADLRRARVRGPPACRLQRLRRPAGRRALHQEVPQAQLAAPQVNEQLPGQHARTAQSARASEATKSSLSSTPSGITNG